MKRPRGNNAIKFWKFRKQYVGVSYKPRAQSASMLEEIRTERLKKLALLKERGRDPYPCRTRRTHTLAAVLRDFSALAQADARPVIAGRIMSKRAQGALTFLDLFDGTARLQAVLKRDEMEDGEYDFFLSVVDQGDFIEVEGPLFTTKRGQQSLLVTRWAMLSKSLQPIPDEWYGLKDEDERYRKRYLDFLLNPASREIVERKAAFWRAVRTFHEQRGFLEVRTPVLESTPGGGDARPFVTHHHALDMDVYLRISAGELWQKRLMVAGFPKTFEIGRIFRNEGMSSEHLQDYDQCEAYWAYADYRAMYTFLRECFQFVAEETFGTLKFSMRGFEVNLGGEWEVADYATLIREHLKVDIWKEDREALAAKADELGITHEPEAGKGRLVDLLWKQVRKNIAGPLILVNEPLFTSPLAKKIPDKPHMVERFHFVIAGSELGQGYSELNDPLDQCKRFEEQQALRDAGDEEAHMADWDFVEALEYGMPPAAGHGFSERYFAYLVDKPVRETQLFPLMRPRPRS